MKKYRMPWLATFILSMFVCMLITCGPQAENAQAENVKLIQNYFTAFNEHNWNKMASMYSDSAEFKDPSLGFGIVKLHQSQIIEKYIELVQLFPDVHDEITKLYPSGKEHVIVEFISRGTGPDTKPFELPICTIFTIKQNKICKDYTYYDNFGDEAEQ